MFLDLYFYQNSLGDSPVLNFLKSLSGKTRGRFICYLEHLSQNNANLDGVAFRKLYGYPLEEIRIKESKNLHRIIIKTRVNDKILILHGFTKKEGEKTPIKEIESAFQNYKNIMSQFENE